MIEVNVEGEEGGEGRAEREGGGEGENGLRDSLDSTRETRHV